MLGDNPWLWCWPTVPPGNGLKYPVVDPNGEWMELQGRAAEFSRRMGAWERGGAVEP